MNSQLDIVDSW